MNDDDLKLMATTQCDQEMRACVAALGVGDNVAGRPVKLPAGLGIFLTAFAKVFGKLAVRPVLGLLGQVVGVDQVKAECKTWIANNGG